MKIGIRDQRLEIREKPAEGKARSGRFVNRPYGEEKRKARSCGELELITPKRRQKKEQQVHGKQSREMYRNLVNCAEQVGNLFYMKMKNQRSAATKKRQNQSWKLRIQKNGGRSSRKKAIRDQRLEKNLRKGSMRKRLRDERNSHLLYRLLFFR